MPFNSIQYDLPHNFPVNVCHLLTKLHFLSQSVVPVAIFSVVSSEVFSLVFAMLVFLRLSKSWPGLMKFLNVKTRRTRWRIWKCGFKFFQVICLIHVIWIILLTDLDSRYSDRQSDTIHCGSAKLHVKYVGSAFHLPSFLQLSFGTLRVSSSLSVRKDPGCGLWLKSIVTVKVQSAVLVVILLSFAGFLKTKLLLWSVP